MAIDLNTLFKAFSDINQNIAARGDFNVSPDPEFDYMAQLDRVMNRTERLRQQSVMQALKNGRIRLSNQATLPPHIKFPNVTVKPGHGGGHGPAASRTGEFEGGSFWHFDPFQINNAITIAQVAKKLGGGRRDILAGISGALVESNLKNVNYGDRDSLGMFQQRAPWGSAQARTNPRKAARMFYQGGHGGQQGLFDISKKVRRHRPIGVNVQDVQVSAYPGRYQDRLNEARQILAFINRKRLHG